MLGFLGEGEREAERGKEQRWRERARCGGGRREVGEGGEGGEACGGGQGERTNSRTLRTLSGAPTTFVAWPRELATLLLLHSRHQVLFSKAL